MQTKTMHMARPTVEQLDRELNRRQHKKEYGHAARGVVWVLIVVAAAVILCANYFLAVLQIQGVSMSPTLQEGDIVLAARNARFSTGDVIAFYYNNKILVKRVIGGTGDWVDIDKDGNVSVNGVPNSEPYLTDKALGECDITLPYQVPDERYFVMGDHRATSVDSRTQTIGCVAQEQVAGKVLFRLWPLSDFGPIH